MDPGLRSRNAGGADRRDRRQGRSDPPGERADGQDRDVGRGLRGRGAREWVQRLEEDVSRRDERDPRDAERHGLHPGPRRQRDRVSGLGLKSRLKLLVENDRAGLEPPAQESEGLDVGRIVPWDCE